MSDNRFKIDIHDIRKMIDESIEDYDYQAEWVANTINESKFNFSHLEKQFDNYSEPQNDNQLMNNNNVQYGQ